MSVTELDMSKRIGEAVGFNSREYAHVCRQADFCPTDGSPAAAYVPTMRGSISGEIFAAVVLSSRSVFVHVACATEGQGASSGTAGSEITKA